MDNHLSRWPAAAEEEGVLINLDKYISPTGAAADLWQYLQDNPTMNREVKNDEGSYYCFPLFAGINIYSVHRGLFTVQTYSRLLV